MSMKILTPGSTTRLGPPFESRIATLSVVSRVTMLPAAREWQDICLPDRIQNQRQATYETFALLLESKRGPCRVRHSH